jgi:hypothetical protein
MKHKGPDECKEPIAFYNMIQILCIFLNLSSFVEPPTSNEIHNNLLNEFHLYLRNCPKQKFSIKTLCLLVMIESNLLLKIYIPRPVLNSSIRSNEFLRKEPILNFDQENFSINSNSSRQNEKYLKSFLRTLLLLVRQIMKRFGIEPSSRKEVESFLSIVLSTFNNFHSKQRHIFRLLLSIDKHFDQILTFIINFFIENDFKDSRKTISFLKFFCLLVVQHANIIKRLIRKNKIFFEKILSFLVTPDFLCVLTDPKKLKLIIRPTHFTFISRRNHLYSLNLFGPHMNMNMSSTPLNTPRNDENPSSQFSNHPRKESNFEMKITPKKNQKIEYSNSVYSSDKSPNDLNKNINFR